MKRKVLIYIFVLVAIVQISVPIYMINKHEMILSKGKQFKFYTAPIDPYDAFRGRYVNVGIKNRSVPVLEDTEFLRNQKVYVHLEEDTQGFADMVGISLKRPEKIDYLETKIDYIDQDRIYVRIPFDRYYMEEKLAPAAEDAYRDNPEGGYMTVRIRSGFAVPEQLYINGEPIEEYLKE